MDNYTVNVDKDAIWLPQQLKNLEDQFSEFGEVQLRITDRLGERLELFEDQYHRVISLESDFLIFKLNYTETVDSIEMFNRRQASHEQTVVKLRESVTDLQRQILELKKQAEIQLDISPGPISDAEKWEAVDRAAHQAFKDIDWVADDYDDQYIDMKIASSHANRVAAADDAATSVPEEWKVDERLFFFTQSEIDGLLQVHDRYRTYNGASRTMALAAIINVAVPQAISRALELGLVSPRIDPDDERQVRLVMDAAPPPVDDDVVSAKRILTALQKGGV